MIIIGTMGIPFTQSKGTFYCPRCRTDVNYRERHVRRFLTIYFVPLIPLDKIEEYVECGKCRGHFPREVLTHSAEQSQDAFRGYVRYTLALVAAADDKISQAEMATYQDLLKRLYGVAPTSEEVLRDLSAAKESGHTIGWYLRTINPLLAVEERKTLVQFAFLMASSEGQISETRNVALSQFPSALGLTEGQFKQFIAEAVAVG